MATRLRYTRIVSDRIVAQLNVLFHRCINCIDIASIPC